MKNVHGHFFNHQTIPADIYFGRHGLSKKTMKFLREIMGFVHKSGLPSNVEDVIAFAEKILPLFGLDDEWDAIKYLLKIYYMTMDKLVKYYSDTVMPNAGITEMCVLIPNFQDKYTRDAVDIICACTEGNKKFKIFAPIDYIKRKDVHGVKFYPALEGPPDDIDWKIAADLNKAIVSHSSPGGVRNKNIPESLAKKYNYAGRWMDALDKYPIRLNLAHTGGRDAFVRWFAKDKTTPGINWAYNNMMLTYDGSERPGKLFCDISFHEGQTKSDYRKAIGNIDPWWRIMFGIDDPLTEIVYSVKVAAGWYRNVWGTDWIMDSDKLYDEFVG